MEGGTGGHTLARYSTFGNSPSGRFIGSQASQPLALREEFIELN